MTVHFGHEKTEHANAPIIEKTEVVRFIVSLFSVQSFEY